MFFFAPSPYLTIKSDSGQHSQFLRCFGGDEPNKGWNIIFGVYPEYGVYVANIIFWLVSNKCNFAANIFASQSNILSSRAGIGIDF